MKSYIFIFELRKGGEAKLQPKEGQIGAAISEKNLNIKVTRKSDFLKHKTNIKPH